MMSVNKNCATFGQETLRLRYSVSVSKRKLRLFGALTIGFAYLKSRMSSISSWTGREDIYQNCKSAVDRVDSLLSLFNILSFILFIRRGGPVTLLERVLGVTPVSTVSPSKRSIGYSHMTRELLWNGLIELLVLVIPLINYHKLRRTLKSLYGNRVRVPSATKPVLSVNTECIICSEHPVMPYSMGCAHVFCYYCLSSQRLADIQFECPACGVSDPKGTNVTPIKI